MNKKIFLLFLLILGIIYFHFVNKHQILKYNHQIENQQLQITSLKELNLYNLIENNKLSSKERIEKLAADKLDMFYPMNPETTYNISFDDKDQSVRLINYFVPSAEALTN